LGCDPANAAPQSTLFSSAECSCFVPLVCGEGKAGDKQKRVCRRASAPCFNCGRDGALHALRTCDSSDFLEELCRVGSVGWEPHAFMQAAYGRTHLGVEFNAAQIEQSHALYLQHVSALLGNALPGTRHCADLCADVVPDVTVYVIPEGKTKDGKMRPLLEQRRAELDRMCSHIELLIGPSSPLGTPSTPASPSAAACSTPTARSKAYDAAAALKTQSSWRASAGTVMSSSLRAASSAGASLLATANEGALEACEPGAWLSFPINVLFSSLKQTAAPLEPECPSKQSAESVDSVEIKNYIMRCAAVTIIFMCAILIVKRRSH
jgi:hypothetical protein